MPCHYSMAQAVHHPPWVTSGVSCTISSGSAISSSGSCTVSSSCSASTVSTSGSSIDSSSGSCTDSSSCSYTYSPASSSSGTYPVKGPPSSTVCPHKATKKVKVYAAKNKDPGYDC